VLKERVISAIVMALIFVAALFSKVGFVIFVTLGTAVAAWEWAALAGLSRRHRKFSYVGFLFVIVSLCAVLVGMDDNLEGVTPDKLRYFMILALVWWLVALIMVKSYPISANFWGKSLTILLIGTFVLVPTWVGLTFLRSQDNGSWLILLLVSIVASADIGAYFVGRKFGKTRLAATVSPGKSWEGVFGGLAAATLLALIVGQVWLPEYRFTLLLLALPTACISVLGDLLESMIKRHRGVKDSGLLFPGHGGVLDRVDGITAAVPVFTLMILISGFNLSTI
jgi:phosphatidate cytidylyltransferase